MDSTWWKTNRGVTLRLIPRFSYVLRKAPLQFYGAGLLFRPAKSMFRRSFRSRTSTDFEVGTRLPLKWNACTQTLEGHSDLVGSVVFSSDGSRVASGLENKMVRVWDVRTDYCQRMLKVIQARSAVCRTCRQASNNTRFKIIQAQSAAATLKIKLKIVIIEGHDIELNCTVR